MKRLRLHTTTASEVTMQNFAFNTAPVQTAPTHREPTLILLSSLPNTPEPTGHQEEDNDFIFTKYHSPTSD